MALQVWLPLISDLRQQGIADTSTITLASGNAFVNGGKVGNKALHLTKQQTVLGTSSCMSGKKQMSYAFWVKVNTAWSAQWLDGIAWYSTDGSSAAYSRQEFYTNCTRIGTWFSGSSLSGYVFTPGEWTHIAGTFDYTAGIAKFYINGVLQGTSTSLSKTHYCRGDFYIGDSGVDIVENDVRIYDHCLSPMEVKELSKGLILHYPLNRQGWGQENLVHNSNQFRVGGHAKGVTPSVEVDGTYKVIAESGNSNYSSSWWKEVTGIEDEFAEGDAFTVSFWIKSSDANKTTPPTIYLKSGMGYYSMKGTVSANYSQVYYTGTWKKANGLAPHLGWSGLVGTYYICQWKIEKGSIPTPWCPNSSDTLATTMGLNGTTEYDTSGYCNNLNRNGTYSYTSDTPKYEVSTVFNGTEWMNGSTPGAEIKTLACWAKTTKNKSTSQFMVADSTSNMCISFFSGCIIGVFGSTRSTGSKCTLGLSYKENDWNHFVVVKTGDSGERSIYCNGEPLVAASNDYWGSATGLFIGNRNNSATSSFAFYGELCDVRAYATALSADDVKSLYQNCATIDSDGTIRGQIRS